MFGNTTMEKPCRMIIGSIKLSRLDKSYRMGWSFIFKFYYINICWHFFKSTDNSLQTLSIIFNFQLSIFNFKTRPAYAGFLFFH